MAVSFTRPDPSSPASVADAGFNTSRRGFDQHEVRDFLRMVAAELGRLQERERFLERELRSAQTNADLSAVQLDNLAVQVDALKGTVKHRRRYSRPQRFCPELLLPCLEGRRLQLRRLDGLGRGCCHLRFGCVAGTSHHDDGTCTAPRRINYLRYFTLIIIPGHLIATPAHEIQVYFMLIVHGGISHTQVECCRREEYSRVGIGDTMALWKLLQQSGLFCGRSLHGNRCTASQQQGDNDGQ